MPTHPFQRPRGRLVEIELASDHLAENLVGDPAARVVAVYLPPGYDEGDDDYPLFVDLTGFTGSGLAHVGWKAFAESVPQRLDRLVAEGAMGPVICAFPDCFTSLGGNQYVDSAALGRWASHLLEVVIPALEDRYRVRKGPAHRAVFGKSSGGYGAMVHAMRHGPHWGAAACHSGDMAFELCYQPDFPKTLQALARHDGVEGFLAHLRAGHKVSGGDFHALMILAMAASYDPDPAAPYGIRLPVDPHTCRLDPAAWERWLAHDPVRLIEHTAVQQRLRGLRGLWIDCGARDQYHLHFGARQLVERLAALRIPHVYEEFDDDHSGIDYRMDRSLPFLYRAVA